MLNCRQDRERFHAKLAVEPPSKRLKDLVLFLGAMPNFPIVSNTNETLLRKDYIPFH